MMQVTDEFYQEGQYLSITAYATSFGSDPDIYISTSMWAHGPGEADWYCDRKGTDICIVPASEIEIGLYYYIVVMCNEACTYDLKSYYVTEYDLAQNDKQTFRWNGTSTNILKYTVPRTTASGANTGRWTLQVDPEYKFEEFSVYLSFGSKFELVEEVQDIL